MPGQTLPEEQGHALAARAARGAGLSGPPVSEDEPLVAAAARGDEAAFTELYDRHYDRVLRHVSYRVGRGEDAEDLTQLVFLQAWRALGRYRQTGSPFLAWLFTIVHNVVVSYYRRAKPAQRLPPDVPARRPDGNPGHEVWLERERVRQAIGRLKPDQQQVVTMRFLEDLPYGDIAAALSKTEGHVRVIQHRALQELRHILGREER